MLKVINIRGDGNWKWQKLEVIGVGHSAKKAWRISILCCHKLKGEITFLIIYFSSCSVCLIPCKKETLLEFIWHFGNRYDRDDHSLFQRAASYLLKIWVGSWRAWTGPYCPGKVVSMKMTTIGSCVWVFSSELLELLGNDEKVWSSWRSCVTGDGLWGFKRVIWFTLLSLCLVVIDQNVSSQTFLLMPPWTLTL